ncbi:MAG: CBS domain-containing protein [Gammaproteobacteria bacterium]
MKTVRQLLQTKPGQIWSIDPDLLVFDALKEMALRGVGALLVMKDGKICGVISERDYARKVLLKGRTARDTPVRDIMSTEVVFAHPEDTVETCMKRMTEKRIRHLPVEHAGEVLGVISIGDLVKAIISDQQETIEQLESYIHS